MNDHILSVRDVHKRFDGVQAVAGVSLDVRRGEIFALLGPNGAGKTTLSRMILDIIRPDTGAIVHRLGGGESQRPDPARTGYLPEDRGLYKDIPILRTLTYFGELRGMARRAATAAAEAWLERLDLKSRARDKLDALSKGNQQKVQFIAAIVHAPELALLDEPFSGLDPINQDFFLDLLRELRDGGMTIVLSAHQMPLVERIADRVLLMSKGRAVLHGTLDEVRRSDAAGDVLSLTLKSQPASLDDLRAHPAVAAVESDGDGTLRILVRREAALGDLLAAAAGTLDIAGVHSERLSLHDIYVRAIRGDGHAPDRVQPAAGPPVPVA